MLPFHPPVRREKIEELIRRMQALGIKEEDLLERFVRSSGHGGQKLNKTSTCVYLKHIPTSVEVKCQKTRSQVMNRFLARRILVEKIEALRNGLESPEMKRIRKIRKQKLKRKKRARAKVESRGS